MICWQPAGRRGLQLIWLGALEPQSLALAFSSSFHFLNGRNALEHNTVVTIAEYE